jgi:hypothetical protein
LSFINIFFFFAAEWQFQKISSSFTPGDFRQVAPRTRRKEVSSISAEDPEEKDDSEVISKYSYVLKRVAHVLSKGTLHWKNTLHLEHAARQSREKLNSTWQSLNMLQYFRKVKARCRQ